MCWNRSNFEDAFPFEPLGPVFHVLTRPPAPRIDTAAAGLDAGRSPTLHALEANRAVLNCYEPLHLSGDVQADRPVVFGDDSVRISDVVFAPDRVVFRAIAGQSPGRVYLNERYAEGWSSDAGPMNIDGRGLGYVEMAAGRAGRFSFRFVPPRLYTGLAVFIVGVALAIPVARRRW